MAPTARPVKVKGPKICEPGGADNGLLFPAGGDAEAELPNVAKAIIYGLALGYLFLGVAIIADVFMSAIETITSKKRRIYDKVKQRHRTIKVWNETVANLTLMALGSSAPEILLNVIEVGRNEMFAGELGPGTIVGSAAFNLFCITAVCVVCIPTDEIRMIKDVPVYAVTAVFSLFAYIWIIVILVLISKDVVAIWEAVVTLLYFPILVFIAFCADKGWIGGIPAVAARRRVVAAEMTREELAELITEIKKEFGDLDDDTVAILVEKRTAARPSKAVYRAEQRKKKLQTSKSGNASGAGGSMTLNWANAQKSESDIVANTKSMGMTATSTIVPEGQATVEFANSAYAVLESAKFLQAEVRRYDDMKSRVTVKYRTVSGTAQAGKDFVDKSGELVFDAEKQAQLIPVEILNDDEWEQAEDFYIELYEAKCDSGSVFLGPNTKTTVTIIDDDDPGVLQFEKDFVQWVEHHGDPDNSEFTCILKVLRKHGSKGDVSCKCTTEDDTAVAELDYERFDDALELKNGEMAKEISLAIKPRGRYDRTEQFRVLLSDPVGCRFSNETDGGADQCICTVEIQANPKHQESVDKLAQTLVGNWDKARIGTSNWKEQFVGALYVGGSAEDQKEAGCVDWFFHVLSLPWKLFFATVPPPDFIGGWACFTFSLIYIGGVTAAIGDLAALFGCALGLPDPITAITFVALGTSLPDTFASKSAATQDPFADACITNITGSNSVNVFLGLGLPWTIAAIFWAGSGQTDEWKRKMPLHIQEKYSDGLGVYVLEASSLGFSVAVFTSAAITAMGALLVRRLLFGGELGGPAIPKYATGVFLVALWVGYVAASWVYISLDK